MSGSAMTPPPDLSLCDTCRGRRFEYVVTQGTGSWAVCSPCLDALQLEEVLDKVEQVHWLKSKDIQGIHREE